MRHLFLVLLILSCSFCRSQCNEGEFVKFVNECVLALKEISKEKYSTIVGIELEADRTGYVISYTLYFSNKNQKLNKKEYKCILKKLRKRSYPDCIRSSYSLEELERETTLKWKKKMTPE